MANDSQEMTFPEIKKSLLDAVERIEKHIQESEKDRQESVKERQEMVINMAKMHIRIYGNNEIDPPVEGHETRLRRLELVEESRLKNKREMLNLAIGSFTIAVGGVILWILSALKVMFIKGH